MDLLNLSGQYTFGESNRISRFKISGGVTLDLGSVMMSLNTRGRHHWSGPGRFMRILGPAGMGGALCIDPEAASKKGIYGKKRFRKYSGFN